MSKYPESSQRSHPQEDEGCRHGHKGACTQCMDEKTVSGLRTQLREAKERIDALELFTHAKCGCGVVYNGQQPTCSFCRERMLDELRAQVARLQSQQTEATGLQLLRAEQKGYDRAHEEIRFIFAKWKGCEHGPEWHHTADESTLCRIEALVKASIPTEWPHWVSFALLHWYLESQIAQAFGFDDGERAHWRANAEVGMTRTLNGGWWSLRRGEIPWRP